jgi:hypothetical protein
MEGVVREPMPEADALEELERLTKRPPEATPGNGGSEHF